MSEPPIPDPDAPKVRAIGPDGELLAGVFWIPIPPDGPAAVTAEDLERGEHVGWTKPELFIDLEEDTPS